MTRDDILRLAREAGIEQWWDKANACQDTYEAALAHFAELVAAAEREACAKRGEDYLVSRIGCHYGVGDAVRSNA